MSADRWSEFHALAPAFALGALEAEERVRFEAALADSAELRQEVSRYVEVAATLGLGIGEVPPPADLKARLMARVRDDATEPAGIPRDPTAIEGIDFDALEWTPPKHGSGFEIHWLRHDRETGEMAALLRGGPNATYPDHMHPGGEHFFILQGTCADHRAEYRAGDFYSYPPGSVHRNLRSTGEGICILLVITGPGGIRMLEQEAGAP